MMELQKLKRLLTDEKVTEYLNSRVLKLEN